MGMGNILRCRPQQTVVRTYYNYKLFHSIILMAMVDAHYRVIMFDFGVNGHNSDGGVFASSTMSSGLENTMNIPTK